MGNAYYRIMALIPTALFIEHGFQVWELNVASSNVATWTSILPSSIAKPFYFINIYFEQSDLNLDLNEMHDLNLSPNESWRDSHNLRELEVLV